MRRLRWWKKRVLGGVVAIEVTRLSTKERKRRKLSVTTDQGWHPHVHGLLDCDWLAVDESKPGPTATKEQWKRKATAAANELAEQWSLCLGRSWINQGPQGLDDGHRGDRRSCSRSAEIFLQGKRSCRNGRPARQAHRNAGLLPTKHTLRLVLRPSFGAKNSSSRATVRTMRKTGHHVTGLRRQRLLQRSSPQPRITRPTPRTPSGPTPPTPGCALHSRFLGARIVAPRPLVAPGLAPDTYECRSVRSPASSGRSGRARSGTLRLRFVAPPPVGASGYAALRQARSRRARQPARLRSQARYAPTQSVGERAGRVPTPQECWAFSLVGATRPHTPRCSPQGRSGGGLPALPLGCYRRGPRIDTRAATPRGPGPEEPYIQAKSTRSVTRINNGQFRKRATAENKIHANPHSRKFNVCYFNA